jgi:hypothetical protein
MPNMYRADLNIMRKEKVKLFPGMSESQQKHLIEQTQHEVAVNRWIDTPKGRFEKETYERLLDELTTIAWLEGVTV